MSHSGKLPPRTGSPRSSSSSSSPSRRPSPGSRPRSGPVKKSSKKNGNPAAVVAGIAGSVVLMLVVGFIAFFVLGKSANDSTVTSSTTTTETPASTAPTSTPSTPSVKPGEGFLRKDSSLVAAKAAFKSNLRSVRRESSAVDQPPAGVFDLVQYDAPVGKLNAYVSSDPNDGKKHPAIIWITGGDCNSIGEIWLPAPPENDQTAAQYRQAGMVMMYPSLRGGNNNPGQKEGFLGEVEDVIAAAEYLSKKSYVDPENLYLGGHSTGGTLALLVAASTNKFKATFAFGGVDKVAGYGQNSDFLPYNTQDAKEHEMRSPIHWVKDIQTPVYVLEGYQGNIDCVMNLQGASIHAGNKNLLFYPLQKTDHFRILQPANQYIAAAIKKSVETNTPLEISKDELQKLFLSRQPVSVPGRS